MTEKSDIISQIFSLTKVEADKYFDKLVDLPLTHLTKLLQVCIKLNVNKATS